MMKTCDKTGQTYIDLAEVANWDRHLSKALRPHTRALINVGLLCFMASLASAFAAFGQ